MDDSDKSPIDELSPTPQARRRKRRKKRTSSNRNQNLVRSTSQSDFARGENNSEASASTSALVNTTRTSIGSIASSSRQYYDNRTSIRRKPTRSKQKNSLEKSTISDKSLSFTGVPETEVKSETTKAKTRAETYNVNDEKQSKYYSNTIRNNSENESKEPYDVNSRDPNSSNYDNKNEKQRESELLTETNSPSIVRDSYQNALSQTGQKYLSVNTRRDAADKSSISNSVVSSEKSYQSSKVESVALQSQSEQKSRDDYSQVRDKDSKKRNCSSFLLGLLDSMSFKALVENEWLCFKFMLVMFSKFLSKDGCNQLARWL